MINYNKALELIKNNIINSEIINSSIEITIEDSIGFILDEDIYSDINLPNFNNSSMDGYAIKYSENKNNWKIIGEVKAGSYSKIYELKDDNEISELDCDSAVSIMTGAKIPVGADTVIPIENIDINEDRIFLKSNIEISKYANTRLIGEDIGKNNLILKKNTEIKSQHIPILAACGKTYLKIKRKLKIGILATGDELVDLDVIPKGDQIRCSNIYSLISLINSSHAIPINFGFVKDDFDIIKLKLKEILESDVDFIITTGGISVGKYDLIKSVFNTLGVEEIFWRVNIKPGKPIYFGKYQNNNYKKFIFGLPGNPLSAYINFQIFLKHAIGWSFDKNYTENQNKFKAILNYTLQKNDSKRYFVISNFKYDLESDKYFVEQTGSQSSGGMFTLTKSNCMIEFPEEENLIQIGDEVTCIKC